MFCIVQQEENRREKTLDDDIGISSFCYVLYQKLVEIVLLFQIKWNMKHLNILYKMLFIEGGKIRMSYQGCMLRKTLVIGIIIIFIGLVVQPSITSDAIITNNPPESPIVCGPIPKRVGIKYEQTIASTDPDNDDIANYTIDWGDDIVDVIEGPFPSGAPIEMNHTWHEAGWYLFRCKANDIHGAESNWTEFLLRITNNKISYNSLFLWFLEHFPLLEKLLNLLR